MQNPFAIAKRGGESKGVAIIKMVGVEIARTGAAFGSQFAEHAIGGSKGINVPFLNVPVSIVAGLGVSILGKTLGGELGDAANEVGKATRAASIGVIGATVGLTKHG